MSRSPNISCFTELQVYITLLIYNGNNFAYITFLEFCHDFQLGFATRDGWQSGDGGRWESSRNLRSTLVKSTFDVDEKSERQLVETRLRRTVRQSKVTFHSHDKLPNPVYTRHLRMGFPLCIAFILAYLDRPYKKKICYVLF